jgi:hypothetical protein
MVMRENPAEAFTALNGQLERARNKPEFVRIHVSGEFESETEFVMWDAMAALHPDVTFYVYSKAYDILGECFERYSIQSNLVVNVSVWHDYGVEFFKRWQHLPNVRAFVYDDGFDYESVGIVADSHCPAYDRDGNTVEGVTCAKCRMCAGKRARKVTFCPAH